tara:strand:+ start:951 stop:1337 length:387 start_codon:yes stop_codon:yes gene_type:complete
MINSITIFGHLGADPEERAGNSRTFAKGRLGVSQPKDKPTMWFDLVCFNQWAMRDLMRGGRGSGCVVTGQLEMREYQGKVYYSIICSGVRIEGPDAHDIGATERPLRDRPSAGSGTPDPEAGLDEIPF